MESTLPCRTVLFLMCCVSCRTYNIQAISFTPRELVEEMKKYFPDMQVTYEPDERQAIGKYFVPPVKRSFCEALCVQLTVGLRCWMMPMPGGTGAGGTSMAWKRWWRRWYASSAMLPAGLDTCEMDLAS